MADRYTVTFDRIGRNHYVKPLVTGDIDGPNHLAQVIHDYARPHLGSREVDVHLDLDKQSGMIFVGGFRNAGSFTLAEMPEDGETP
jgi:hypothetical protein